MELEVDLCTLLLFGGLGEIKCKRILLLGSQNFELACGLDAGVEVQLDLRTFFFGLGGGGGEDKM